jgi:hypothetical protein
VGANGNEITLRSVHGCAEQRTDLAEVPIVHVRRTELPEPKEFPGTDIEGNRGVGVQVVVVSACAEVRVLQDAPSRPESHYALVANRGGLRATFRYFGLMAYADSRPHDNHNWPRGGVASPGLAPRHASRF